MLDLLCPTFPYFTPLTFLSPSLLSLVTSLYFAFLSFFFPLPLPHFTLPLLCPTFPSELLPSLAFTYFALLWPPNPSFLLLPSYQSSLLTYHQVSLTYLLLPHPANYYQVTPKPLTCPQLTTTKLLPCPSTTCFFPLLSLPLASFAPVYFLYLLNFTFLSFTFPYFTLLCPSSLPLLT